MIFCGYTRLEEATNAIVCVHNPFQLLFVHADLIF